MSQNGLNNGAAGLVAKGWFLVALTLLILMAGNPRVSVKVQNIKSGVTQYLHR